MPHHSGPQFDCTRSEFELITAICGRYDAWRDRNGLPAVERLPLFMDITACHRSGCPLDLEALAGAPEADFVHDIAGIQRHIDRRTGRLGDCFLPRFAKLESAR